MKISSDKKSVVEDAASADPRTKICSSCKQEKSLDDFYRAGETKRQSRCKQCSNTRRWEGGRFHDEEHKQKVLASNRESYARNRDNRLRRQFERRLKWKAVAVGLLGGTCVDCGQDNPMVLEFDHRDPDSKAFEVTKAFSSPVRYPWSVVEEEIAKCDLRCRSCHALRHLGFELTKIDDEWIVGERKTNRGQKVLKSKTRGEDFLGQKGKSA